MARYVDAERLEDGAFPEVLSEYMRGWNDALKGAALALPAADVVPKPEWVSVKERLPEPNENCLVSARVGDQVVIDLGELVQYWDARTNEHGFIWMITNDWDEGEGCEITHWMPLPEPPTEGGRP